MDARLPVERRGCRQPPAAWDVSCLEEPKTSKKKNGSPGAPPENLGGLSGLSHLVRKLGESSVSYLAFMAAFGASFGGLGFHGTSGLSPCKARCWSTRAPCGYGHQGHRPTEKQMRLGFFGLKYVRVSRSSLLLRVPEAAI